MATRYPLVIDTTDGNKIKELPENDNLNLATNNIVNVVNVTASGAITAQSLNIDTANVTINQTNLATVALTNSYLDLDDTPIAFSGRYIDLTDLPNLVTNSAELSDVSATPPTDGQILMWSQVDGFYEPVSISKIQNQMDDLADVAYVNILENQVLKYSGTEWLNGWIDYAELTGTDNVVVKINGTATTNLKGSVFDNTDSLVIDANTGKIYGTLLGNWDNSNGTFTITSDKMIVNSQTEIRLSTLNPLADIVISAVDDVRLEGQNLRLSAPDIFLTGNINCGTSLIRAAMIEGDLQGSVFGDDSTTLIDGVNNQISAAHLTGQLPSLDASNLYNLQISNSDYINYGYDGLNDVRTVLDLSPILKSDGNNLTLSITVSPSYTKVLIELNVTAINLTDVSSECYVALQRSTDSGATWTTLDSCQTTAVETTSSSYANVRLGSFVRWIDEHGESNSTTILYRFINNTDAVMGSGVNDQIRIYYENASCVASAREVK